MATKTTSVTLGGSFLNTLTIVFIVLKLTHYIDWSWWWILSPLWIPIAIIFLLALCWAIIAAYMK